MPDPKKPHCRQCNSADVACLGPIPEGRIFAGQQLAPAWEGGRLYECRNCHLGFRYPIMPEQEYERLYESASDDVWVSRELRPDQRRVKCLIEGLLKSGKVLDVGCYDGKLLASLSPELEKYGVEASTAAAQAARGRGVDIVASRIGQLESLEAAFDAICAVDVIEHTVSPSKFVTTLLRLLAPGGLLVLSTGTLDTPAWRFAGGRYWYCGIPEHISFISPKWARLLAQDNGLSIVADERFAYYDLADRRRASERRRYYSEVARSNVKLVLASLIPLASVRKTPRYSYGIPGVFEDHFVLAFNKKATVG